MIITYQIPGDDFATQQIHISNMLSWLPRVSPEPSCLSDLLYATLPSPATVLFSTTSTITDLAKYIAILGMPLGACEM